MLNLIIGRENVSLDKVCMNSNFILHDGKNRMV
jgi:hypothetical protein